MTENSDFVLDDNSSTGDPGESEKVATDLTNKTTGFPDLKSELKLTIYNHINFFIQNGQWTCHLNKEIREEYYVRETTVSRLVRMVKVDCARGLRGLPDLAPKCKGICGTKCKWTTPQILKKLESAPVELQGSSRDCFSIRMLS